MALKNQSTPKINYLAHKLNIYIDEWLSQKDGHLAFVEEVRKSLSLRGTKQSHGSRAAMHIRPVQFAVASYLAMT